MTRNKLRAAAVQVRPIARDIDKTIDQGVKLAKRAAEQGANIICLPEHWLPEETIPTPVDPIPHFQSLAKEFGVTIVAGAFFERVSSQIRLSSPIINPKGRLLGRQFKVHLFWREKKLAKPGNTYQVFRLDGYKAGILVCYDVDFPEPSRIYALNGADIILCPSRIIKGGNQPWQQYVTVRALENRIPIVAPNVYAPPLFIGGTTIVSLRQDPVRKIAHPRLRTLSLQSEGIILEDIDIRLHNHLRKLRFADRRPETYH